MSKVILLTGATDGIGLATAQKLVAQGHTLLIHGRHMEKLQTVEKNLLTLNANARIKSYCADLSDFQAIEIFINHLLEEQLHLDVIINNAGIYKTPHPITQDHLDVRFVVNTLAPYLLSQRLLPLMNPSARIINLSSAAQAPVDLKALTGQYPIDDDFSAYAQSKLAITMWSRYMALNSDKQDPIIIAVNPGSLLASKMVKEGFGVEGKDINIGADLLIRASLDDTFAQASGLYFDNDISDFASPHPDALNDTKCEELMFTMKDLLKKLGVDI